MENIWTIIGVVLAVFTFLQSIAVAYLRLFVSNEMMKMKNEIIEHMDKEYLRADIFREKIKNMEREIEDLKKKVYQDN